MIHIIILKYFILRKKSFYLFSCEILNFSAAVNYTSLQSPFYLPLYLH